MKKKMTKVQKKIKKTMHEFKEGNMHSGTKTGPVVTNPDQAIAIALSKARKVGRVKKRKDKK